MPSLNLEVIERFEGLESVSEFDMAIGLLQLDQLLDSFQLV